MEIRKGNCHYCGYLCGFNASVEDGRLALTRHGMELQNSVVVELWEDE